LDCKAVEQRQNDYAPEQTAWIMNAKMLRAQGLAILEECKEEFSPVMRLVGSEHMLHSFVAGMLDDPATHAWNVNKWSRYCSKRGTDEKIEVAGIKCLSTMYNTAQDMREKKRNMRNDAQES
jgi:hypothetical protein